MPGPGPGPRLRLMRSLWGVVVQEPLLLSLASASGTDTSNAGGSSSSSSPRVKSKIIPSTLDHKLFPSRRSFLQHIKAQGFAGVEASLLDLGATVAERRAYAKALADEGLGLVVGIYSSWQDYDASLNAKDEHYKPVAQHLQQFEAQLREAADLGPLHVNAHSGCDAWAEGEECLPFFEGALALQDRILGGSGGPRVSHETHRGRPLGHPFVAGRLLRRLPELRITADVSHWFVACERLLRCPSPGAAEGQTGEEERLMLLAAERTDHVHARIGSAQMPQVPDPLDRKRFGPEQAAHHAFWAQVRQAHERAGRGTLSMTPEYGPAPYALDPQADVDGLIERVAQGLKEQFDNKDDESDGAR